MGWLEKQKENHPDQPFFLYLPFHEPHEPVASPAELVAQYRDVAFTEDQAQYFANVHNVDLAVGRLIESLERLQLRDNTIIVLTSDHGDMLGAHGGMHQKWHNAYDESIRVPLLISGPGVPAGAVSATPCGWAERSWRV